MLKTTLGAPNSSSIRRSMKAGTSRVDDGDEFSSRKEGRNLLKISFFKMCFLTLKARIAFIRLRKTFIKVLILYYFNLKYHIRIETDMSGFSIDGIISQLSSKYVIYTNPNFSTSKISY